MSPSISLAAILTAARRLGSIVRHEMRDKRGLARADVAGDDDEAFALRQPIAQIGHGLAVRGALEIEFGVGRELERAARQLEICGVHRSLSPDPSFTEMGDARHRTGNRLQRRSSSGYWHGVQGRWPRPQTGTTQRPDSGRNCLLIPCAIRKPPFGFPYARNKSQSGTRRQESAADRRRSMCIRTIFPGLRGDTESFRSLFQQKLARRDVAEKSRRASRSHHKPRP